MKGAAAKEARIHTFAPMHLLQGRDQRRCGRGVHEVKAQKVVDSHGFEGKHLEGREREFAWEEEGVKNRKFPSSPSLPPSSLSFPHRHGQVSPLDLRDRGGHHLVLVGRLSVQPVTLS